MTRWLVARALAVGLGGALLALPLRACAADVTAHAALDRSAPAAGARVASAPRQVDLYFSEPLVASSSASYAVVLDSVGKQVSGTSRVDTANGAHLAAALPGTLDAGSYAVFWKSTSGADGGVALGSFGFSVGVAGSSAGTPTAMASQVFVPDAERSRALSAAGGSSTAAWIGGGLIGVTIGIAATGAAWLWSGRRRTAAGRPGKRPGGPGRR